MNKYNWTKEQLQEAVSSATSATECLQYLGLSGQGQSGRKPFYRLVKEYGIDISHFKYQKTKSQIFDDGTAICSKCKQRKPLSQFGKRNDRKRGYKYYCKQCEQEMYYKDKAKDILEQSKQLKLKYAKYLGGKCQRCEIPITEDNYVIFDFHHLDPSTKEFNISSIHFTDEDKIKSEVDKCILLCSNCHRLEHFEKSKEKWLQT